MLCYLRIKPTQLTISTELSMNNIFKYSILLTPIFLLVFSAQVSARDCGDPSHNRKISVEQAVMQFCDLRDAVTPKDRALGKECFGSIKKSLKYEKGKTVKKYWSSALTSAKPFIPGESCRPAVAIYVEGTNRFDEPFIVRQLCLFEGENYDLQSTTAAETSGCETR